MSPWSLVDLIFNDRREYKNGNTPVVRTTGVFPNLSVKQGACDYVFHSQSAVETSSP